MAYPVSSDDPVVVLHGLAGLGGGGACGGGLLVVPLPGLVWTGSVCQSGSLSSWQHGSTCSAGVESRMGG